MPIVLVAEIVSALVAAAALAALLVQLVKTRGGARRGAISGVWHVGASCILCAAAVVHGACAMAYASGANALAYALGWAGLAAFILSGACMLAPVKRRLSRPLTWHIALFLSGAVLVVAHAIAGRM